MDHRLGLVLSGGGVRGVAHAGVLAALLEEGLRPDCVAGTSSGAIVGALYAAGYSPPEMLEFFRLKNPFRISNLTLTKPGFFDTDKVVADFLEYFPEDSFEALQKKLFITATDLVNARLDIFSSGPLILPILASSSVPLIFTPTRIDGRLYCDGGILNNFPVEPVEPLCDALLGVYATPLKAVRQVDLHSSLAVSQRAFEVGMHLVSKSKFSRCDAVLCPEELCRYGTFDTRRMEEIYQVGHRVARQEMGRILAALEKEASSGERSRRRETESAPPESSDGAAG